MSVRVPLLTASVLGSLGLLLSGLVTEAVGAPGEPTPGPGTVQRRSADDGEDLLRGADLAASTLPHEADLVVVSFGEQGPRIARLAVAFGHGQARFTGSDRIEPTLGVTDGFLRSASRLLQVGGDEERSVRFERLRRKYRMDTAEAVELDTGPAIPLAFIERSTGVLRELLYADTATGLLVRRETFTRDGAPLRTAAYTSVQVDGTAGAPAPASLHEPTQPGSPTSPGAPIEPIEPIATVESGSAGFAVPTTLPLGYGLESAEPVADARVPTLHLVYGDGMYTLSVFEQRGRMRPAAVDGARELRLPEGGAVWRWPGSEPRRIVWSGGDATFTAFTDAPTDELLAVVAGLPTDPPASILDRLGRGFARLLRVLPTNDRSET